MGSTANHESAVTRFIDWWRAIRARYSACLLPPGAHAPVQPFDFLWADFARWLEKELAPLSAWAFEVSRGGANGQPNVFPRAKIDHLLGWLDVARLNLRDSLRVVGKAVQNRPRASSSDVELRNWLKTISPGSTIEDFGRDVADARLVVTEALGSKALREITAQSENRLTAWIDDFMALLRRDQFWLFIPWAGVVGVDAELMQDKQNPILGLWWDAGEDAPAPWLDNAIQVAQESSNCADGSMISPTQRMWPLRRELEAWREPDKRRGLRRMARRALWRVWHTWLSLGNVRLRNETMDVLRLPHSITRAMAVLIAPGDFPAPHERLWLEQQQPTYSNWLTRSASVEPPGPSTLRPEFEYDHLVDAALAIDREGNSTEGRRSRAHLAAFLCDQLSDACSLTLKESASSPTALQGETRTRASSADTGLDQSALILRSIAEGNTRPQIRLETRGTGKKRRTWLAMSGRNALPVKPAIVQFLLYAQSSTIAVDVRQSAMKEFLSAFPELEQGKWIEQRGTRIGNRCKYRANLLNCVDDGREARAHHTEPDIAPPQKRA